MLQGREKAFLKYLSGNSSPLNQNILSQGELSALQELSETAYQKTGTPTYDKSKGQLSYEDYRNDKDHYRVKTLIGRTAPGGITRVGNNWNVVDRYDFNPDDIRRIPEFIKEGRWVSALSGVAAAAPKASAYDISMQIPMTPEQVKRLGSNELNIGGQQYLYEPYQFAQGETIEQAIQKQLAGNRYKPEGENLANYKRVIEQRNKMRSPGDSTFYMPSLPEQVKRTPPKVSLQDRAIQFLNESLAPIMRNPAGY